ncbi:MAG: hypothetical protein ABSG54_10285 [Terriglobia bacterium]|jgi:hypothetical protein
MFKNLFRHLSYLVLGLLLAVSPFSAKQGNSGKGPHGGRPTLPLTELEDIVRGGWAGKMIGVTYGAPTEFRFLGQINEEPRNWKSEELKGALDQGDLCVQMTFAGVMDRVGLDATTAQHGEAFRDSKYRIWGSNLAARRLLRQGVKAPATGHPDYILHANDDAFQIASDFISLIFWNPGGSNVDILA